jgi:CRP-like cAMP-binding protein
MDHAVDGSTLVGVPLFAGLDTAAQNEVAAASRLTRIRAGETLFVQDDAAKAFYVLLAGRVKIAQVTVEGHQVVIAISRLARSSALCPCSPRLAILPVPPAARIALRRAGTSRRRELTTERVEQRVARALLRLFSNVGQPTSRQPDTFPISRQDIAEMTGTTLHTVSRILSGWEQRGLVGGGRMRVVIRDAGGLLAIADDLRHGDHLP